MSSFYNLDTTQSITSYYMCFRHISFYVQRIKVMFKKISIQGGEGVEYELQQKKKETVSFN